VLLNGLHPLARTTAEQAKAMTEQLTGFFQPRPPERDRGHSLTMTA
jgi:hypothetical protein